MRHVLLVANQTAVGAHIRRRIAMMRQTDPDLHVFVLVPATRPATAGADTVVDLTGVEAAGRQLDNALAAFEQIGVQASGEVGDADPMRAIKAVFRRHAFTMILLSTLPAGSSRWIKMDLPHRLRRRYNVVVEHLEATGTELIEASTTEPTAVKVLLVEDEAADIELARKAFERIPEEVEIRVAKNGAEALQYVDMYGVTAVDLLLLDLKMPVVDGHQFLEQAGARFDLDELNVVILTTSTSEADRDRAHALGAGAYVQKDPDFGSFCDLLSSLVADVTPDPAPIPTS